MEPKKNSFVESEEEITIDLVELFYFFLSKIKLLILFFLIGAIAAGAYTYYLITPKYKATAKLYMVSASSESVLNLSDLNLGSSISKDYEVLMKIRPLLQDVIEDLELSYTVDQLNKMVSVSPITDTRIISVVVESADPVEAKDIANEIAKKTITYLPELMGSAVPNIAEKAIVPEKPSSPNLKKNTVLGAFAALALILCILTVMFLMDDTFKTGEDVEKVLGMMPLSLIPETTIQGFNSNKKKAKKGNKRKKKTTGKKKGSRG